ncbi:MAG: hypothetical protein DHS20C18_31690 [Saprospiraceae bacterium]|nr:MAG: hypothetical protein DHS20C18_31690 [Saprospiraceae bacterium]
MARTKKEQQLLLRVGGTIRYHRRQQGLSQDTFARKAEINRSYFAAIERGERNVAVLNLIKIAKALGVEVSELLAGKRDGEIGIDLK